MEVASGNREFHELSLRPARRGPGENMKVAHTASGTDFIYDRVCTYLTRRGAGALDRCSLN